MCRLCGWSCESRNDHREVILISYIAGVMVYNCTSVTCIEPVSLSERNGSWIMVAL